MLPCYAQFMRQVQLPRKLKYFYVKIVKKIFIINYNDFMSSGVN